MANEPTLRKTDIEELEDRVTILEGGTPEPHSNTMTKPELEDLEDRITVLEGGTPGTHTNPMRFEFFTSTEERVEDLEEKQDDRTVTYDVNGGTGSIDPVTVDSGTEITLNDGSTITPPTNKEFIGWCEATTPTEQKPLLTGKYTVTKNVTLYAIYELLKVTLTYDYNGAKDPTGASISEGESYPTGTDVELELGPTHSGWIIPDGKEFAGWTTVKGADYTKVTHIVLDSDITVYALWVDKEPNLIPITVDDELEGFWIKPRVELDPTDPLVSQAYTYISDKGPMGTEFILSSCASGGGTTAARIIFDSDSDSYTHQTIFNDAAINILYKRVETDASISGNDIYELNGIAEIDGTKIDLSTITRPIYIPISDFFTDPITLLDSGTPASCDAVSCKFFFKEDGSR